MVVRFLPLAMVFPNRVSLRLITKKGITRKEVSGQFSCFACLKREAETKERVNIKSCFPVSLKDDLQFLELRYVQRYVTEIM